MNKRNNNIIIYMKSIIAEKTSQMKKLMIIFKNQKILALAREDKFLMDKFSILINQL